MLDTVAEYRTAMASFAAMKNLDVWYAHLDIENALEELGSQLKPKQVKRTEKALAKARTKDSMSAFSKLTHVVDGEPRIVAEPPLIVPIDDLAQGAERDGNVRGAARAAALLPRRRWSTTGACCSRSSA